MNSDNTWTSVGKGGHAISFSPEAAAAFGSKSHARGSRINGAAHTPRAEFPADAAAAFGRKPRFNDSKQFDANAALAFGSGNKSWMGVPEPYGDETTAFSSKVHKDAPEFDASAVAAFGGKRNKNADPRGDFPEAFGKKKSIFAAAAELDIAADGGDCYKLSAFARKRELAARPPEPKKQTYEEMFPSLHGVAGASKAVPTTEKPTLADIMRKRVAEEEAEEARKAALEEQRIQQERAEAAEYARLRNLRAPRMAHMNNYVSYARSKGGSDGHDDHDDETDMNAFTPDDLDYDAYGMTRKNLMPSGPEEDIPELSSEDDDAAEADEY